jgi:hypothetical protein
MICKAVDRVLRWDAGRACHAAAGIGLIPDSYLWLQPPSKRRSTRDGPVVASRVERGVLEGIDEATAALGRRKLADGQ